MRYLAGTRERDAGGGLGHALANRLGDAERDVLAVDLSCRGRKKERREKEKRQRREKEKRDQERPRE